ncbi:MAG: HAD family hydrolase [Bacteroidetes bacterium]|nr:MAG: HAD family hydrolase [Bacteroidota bacterium]
MKKIKTIAFDADDTLWVNEPIFTKTQERCSKIMENYVNSSISQTKLYETEIKNLKLFGYGIKGFMLSMIETAIELSEGKVTGSEIQKIIDLGKEMIAHPVHLLENIKQTLEILKDDYELMIITKGDLFDQESKIARSGIADCFKKIEIVSEKDLATYANILFRHKIDKESFLMIGNSLKSDILPICELGARAVHIPFHTTWAHEMISVQKSKNLIYQELADVSLLPQYLDTLKN